LGVVARGFPRRMQAGMYYALEKLKPEIRGEGGALGRAKKHRDFAGVQISPRREENIERAEGAQGNGNTRGARNARLGTSPR